MSNQLIHSLVSTHLNRAADTSLQKQLYLGIRNAVLNGLLSPGDRLPSTRLLAIELGVSRVTVSEAYEELKAEGYLEGRVGNGTFVTGSLPNELMGAVFGNKPARQKARQPSERGKMLASLHGSALKSVERAQHPESPQAQRLFRIDLPALEEFPIQIWTRLQAKNWRRHSREMMLSGDPAGYYPLRVAIADYVKAVRGVQCSPEQVIVTAGSQQAMRLAAQVLLDPGDKVWTENPSNLDVQSIFQSLGAQVSPIPVDDEGFNVAYAQAHYSQAQMVHVSPSYHYSAAVTMSLGRRLALLDWARTSRAWILEEDYDSEFRFMGRPLAALQGLDQHDCVLYVNTFNRAVYPGLRLGYLIVPPDLVEPFVIARNLGDRQAPMASQIVLTDFIAEGHLQRHIRRMRQLYGERQDVLLTAIRQELGEWLEPKIAQAGLYIRTTLKKRLRDHNVVTAGAKRGLVLAPLSPHYLEPSRTFPAVQGLLLGFAAFKPMELRSGITELKKTLEKLD
jgi:GntR family transcriptional regulator / MocR family aminotransferase